MWCMYGWMDESSWQREREVRGREKQQRCWVEWEHRWEGTARVFPCGCYCGASLAIGVDDSNFVLTLFACIFSSPNRVQQLTTIVGSAKDVGRDWRGGGR